MIFICKLMLLTSEYFMKCLVVYFSQEMTKARDDLRAGYATLGRDPSSPVNRRMWKNKQSEFCNRVADINVKVDRLNMIVPTLYQQIARFNVAKEQQSVIGDQRQEQTESSSSSCDHRQSTADSNSVTLSDVLRELKALFTT